MRMTTQLRNLIREPGLLVLPGVYDGFSARIAMSVGYPALCAGGNAASGSLLGQPDLGQLSMRDFVDHYRRIAEAAETPVLVDSDTGFGGIHQIQSAVGAFERAGIAGMFFEDQAFPKRCGYLPGKAVIPVEEMIVKLKAALDARRDSDFVIIARTDAFGVEGESAAIERAQALAEAGADMTFVQGADTIAAFARICKAVPCPQLANISQASGTAPPTLSQIEEAGASAVIVPNMALLAAGAAVATAMQKLKNGIAPAEINKTLMPMDHYYDIVGLQERVNRETKYL
jgi:2-methylisocitrate lyase-like PEP mutase family enzyme